jgi:hypothetical protein
MIKEDTEKAANDFADREYEYNDIDRNALYKGFYWGAQWRINSVWHDASEKPDMSKEIIVIYPDKSCRVFRPNGVWETLIEVDKFIRWAYVEDLLPNMEE